MILIKYIAILILLLWKIQAIAYELPDLGERSETLISSKTQRRMGKEFMKEVRLSTTVINDVIINDYIQHLGNKLALNANTKRRKFHFFVIDDQSINAFAGPDAHIGINSGTIIAATSESELAAVMAHEIAHVTQHHLERLLDRAKDAQILSTAGALAAMIIGATIPTKPSTRTIMDQTRGDDTTLGDLATGLAVASVGGAVQHMINFTREHEIEADNIGMKILYNSSFDPKAMPSAFEKMQHLRYDYLNETPKFLLTHPVTSDRIAEAKNRANQYQPKEISANETFNLIRARTLVLTNHNSPKTKKNLQAQLKSSKSHLALQYGSILALYENLQLSEATTQLADLQKKYPNEVLLQMLAAQIAEENKQPDIALKILAKALTNYNDYYPLIFQYAETLISAKHSQIACDFIRAKIRKHQNDPNLYRLLARAYAQNNQVADAYQAKAKAFAIEDYGRQAIILLRQALKTPKLSAIDREIINAKIDQLKNEE